VARRWTRSPAPPSRQSCGRSTWRRASIANVEVPGASGHWVALGDRAWHIETIWRAALDVPVQEVPIDVIREIDEDCWFDGRPATVRAVVDHARRIENADLTVPVVLAADGQVLDGMHRIAKAVLCGRTSVMAQRLPTDPDPDWLLPGSASH
jgi:hypothetical protein